MPPATATHPWTQRASTPTPQPRVRLLDSFQTPPSPFGGLLGEVVVLLSLATALTPTRIFFTSRQSNSSICSVSDFFLAGFFFAGFLAFAVARFLLFLGFIFFFGIIVSATTRKLSHPVNTSPITPTVSSQRFMVVNPNIKLSAKVGPPLMW